MMMWFDDVGCDYQTIAMGVHGVDVQEAITKLLEEKKFGKKAARVPDYLIRIVAWQFWLTILPGLNLEVFKRLSVGWCITAVVSGCPGTPIPAVTGGRIVVAWWFVWWAFNLPLLSSKMGTRCLQ